MYRLKASTYFYVFLFLKVILIMEYYIKLLTIFIYKFAIFEAGNLPCEIWDNLPQRHFFTCNRLTATVFDNEIGEGTLPWATPCLQPSRFFFKMRINFSMSKVNFWMFDFIQTKRLNIDSFTNENWNKFKCHRSKISRRKFKKFCC